MKKIAAFATTTVLLVSAGTATASARDARPDDSRGTDDSTVEVVGTDDVEAPEAEEVEEVEAPEAEEVEEVEAPEAEEVEEVEAPEAGEVDAP